MLHLTSQRVNPCSPSCRCSYSGVRAVAVAHTLAELANSGLLASSSRVSPKLRGRAIPEAHPGPPREAPREAAGYAGWLRGIYQLNFVNFLSRPCRTSIGFSYL